jgi:hypothetical protein
MSDIQVLTMVAGLIGFSATVLNLVAFVREKDRGHLKVGLSVLATMALAASVLFFPRVLPNRAQALAARLPEGPRRLLTPWLSPTPTAAPQATTTPDAPPPLQGSFTLELKRNLLGGVDCLMARFQFSNLSRQGARVTAYRVNYLDAQGRTTHSFYRVLPGAIAIPGLGQVQQDVELDPEIRDVWVAGMDREEKERDRVEIHWEGQDAEGRRFEVSGS